MKAINTFFFVGGGGQGFWEKYYPQGGDFFQNRRPGLDVRGLKNTFVFAFIIKHDC